jgi:hypothetical protein
MNLPTKKIIIGNPCSPSKLIEIKEIPLIKIVLTYGGGMGGANRTLYIEEILSETEREMIVRQYNNEITTINKSYIVFREPIKAIFHTTDITSHTNYHTCKYDASISTNLYELSINDSWEYIDEYNRNNPKTFYSNVENK